MIVVCGACDYQWDDVETADLVCPCCGNDGQIEDHVIISEEEE